jgi:3-dehydroquinate synthetase
VSGYGKFLHGEAISIGQVAAARLSERLHGLTVEETRRIQKLFQRAGLPVTLRSSAGLKSRLQAAMRLDKKVSQGEIKFVLAKEIGRVEHGQPVPEPELVRALGFGLEPD